VTIGSERTAEAAGTPAEHTAAGPGAPDAPGPSRTALGPSARTRISVAGVDAPCADADADADADAVGGAGTPSGAAGPAVRRAARPRADAVRNRERIVAAARELFVQYGSEVAFDDIARRAGIGNATLYRHFPDRSSLVREVVVSVLDAVCEQARRATAGEGDPFDAVRRFTHAAAEMSTGALCPMLAEDFDLQHPDLLAGRGRLEESVAALIGAAQAAGRMRPDVAAGDLLVVVSQLTRPLPGSGCDSGDRFARRHLQIYLDGLEAPARSVLPGRSATLQDLREECGPLPRHHPHPRHHARDEPGTGPARTGEHSGAGAERGRGHSHP
jgi:AcrR family transcriptional regulator